MACFECLPRKELSLFVIQLQFMIGQKNGDRHGPFANSSFLGKSGYSRQKNTKKLHEQSNCPMSG